MINVGVGQSKNENSFDAGAEIAKEALSNIEKPSLSIVFSSSKFNLNELLKGIRSITNSPLIGCSTAGEITNNGADTESAVMMCIESERIKAGLGIGKNISLNPRVAGQSAAESAINSIKEEL